MAAQEIFVEYRLGQNKLKQDAQNIANTAKKTEKVVVDSANAGTQAFNKEAQAANKVAQSQKGIQDATKKTTTSFGRMVDSLQGVGASIGIAFGIQQIVNFGKASAEAFIDAEKNASLLLFALKGNEQAQNRLLVQASQLQKTTIYDDDTIIQAQTFLANQGRTEEQIQKVINAAVELSTVTGADLNTSVMQLDATFEGNVGRLAKLDSGFKGLTKTQLANGAAADLLIEKYGGTAKAFGDTEAGGLAKLKNQFGELQEKVGAEVVPVISGFAEALKGLFERDPEKFFKNIAVGQFVMFLHDAITGTEELTDKTTGYEKSLLKVVNATDAEVEAQIELMKQQGLNTAEFERYAETVRAAQIEKTFEQLASVLDITKEKYQQLVDISDKYGISTRINSSLILNIKDATDDQLNAAFERFNKTLGVTRKDFNDYVGIVEEIPPLQEEVAKTTEKAIGPYQKLTKAAADLNAVLLDQIVLGEDTYKTDRKLFEITNQLADVEQKRNDILNAHKLLKIDDVELTKQLAENNKELNKIMMEGIPTLQETTTKFREQNWALLSATTAAIVAQDKYNSLGEQMKRTASYAGELATLADSVSGFLTDVFGEAAEKNAVFLGFSKAVTIAQITLSSIQAVAGGIAKLASANPLDVIGGIASIFAGVGSLISGLRSEVESVNVQTPSFSTGTEYVKLGNNPKGVDTIPALLDEGEGVVTKKANAAYPGLVKAMNLGKAEDYMLSFAAPSMEKTTAENMAASMMLQQGKVFDDFRLSRIGNEQTALLRENNILLRKNLQKSNPRNIQ